MAALADPSQRALWDEREARRAAGDYSAADALRMRLFQHGVGICSDAPLGSNVTPDLFLFDSDAYARAIRDAGSGCLVWSRRKERFCGQPGVEAGSGFFCKDHARKMAGRVPCPNDIRHDVCLARLGSHLRVCQARGKGAEPGEPEGSEDAADERPPAYVSRGLHAAQSTTQQAPPALALPGLVHWPADETESEVQMAVAAACEDETVLMGLAGRLRALLRVCGVLASGHVDTQRAEREEKKAGDDCDVPAVVDGGKAGATGVAGGGGGGGGGGGWGCPASLVLGGIPDLPLEKQLPPGSDALLAGASASKKNRNSRFDKIQSAAISAHLAVVCSSIIIIMCSLRMWAAVWCYNCAVVYATVRCDIWHCDMLYTPP